MPQLPSGKHFAINDYDFRQLISKVGGGFHVHEFMVIEKTEHLLPYVNVLYFKPVGQAVEHDYHERSGKIPDGWQPYQSGFTLGTIGAEVATWTPDDQQGFAEFLAGEFCQYFLRSRLEEVEKVRTALLQEGPAVARVQAWWWKLGIHPLQPGGNDDAA